MTLTNQMKSTKVLHSFQTYPKPRIGESRIPDNFRRMYRVRILFIFLD